MYVLTSNATYVVELNFLLQLTHGARAYLLEHITKDLQPWGENMTARYLESFSGVRRT